MCLWPAVRFLSAPAEFFERHRCLFRRRRYWSVFVRCAVVACKPAFAGYGRRVQTIPCWRLPWPDGGVGLLSVGSNPFSITLTASPINVKNKSKFKLIFYLLVGALIHFGISVSVIVSRLDCGIQPNCVSMTNEVVGGIFSFPLGVVTWVLKYSGVDMIDVVKTYLDRNVFVLFIINSILAVVLVWYVLIKPVLRRRMAGGQ
jgi:hypothetical protein